MSKKIIALLLMLSIAVTMFTACSKQKSNDPSVPGSVSETEVKETLTDGDVEDATEPGTEDEGDNQEDDADALLKYADIDYYGSINENSQYVAAVIHNGNIESSDNEDAKKTYVAVYDMGEAVKDTEMLMPQWGKFVDEGSKLIYHYGVGGNNGIFGCGTNSTTWEKGSMYLSVIDHISAQDGLPWSVQDEVVAIDVIDKNYNGEFRIFGDQWSALVFDDHIRGVDIKIGETSNENVYIQVIFKTPVENDEDVAEAIQQAIDNDIKHSIVVLDDPDDIDSVNYVLGEERDLTTVTFLQDIMAEKVSANYGLNLKNKDVELLWDTRWLAYAVTNKNGERVLVKFDYYEGSYEYMNLVLPIEDMIRFSETQFEYTDSEGNTFNYFADNEQFYIYKNGEFVGGAKTNTKNAFDAVSELFGIRH